MSDFLVDANVLLDIATADQTWMPWSQGQLAAAAVGGTVFVNPIIYAELAPAFASAADLDRWLEPALFVRAALPYQAGWLAARRRSCSIAAAAAAAARRCPTSTSARMRKSTD